MEEEFVIGACTAKKKILVMMAVQSILLIPFKVRLWNTGVGGEILFLNKQLA